MIETEEEERTGQYECSFENLKIFEPEWKNPLGKQAKPIAKRAKANDANLTKSKKRKASSVI